MKLKLSKTRQYKLTLDICQELVELPRMKECIFCIYKRTGFLRFWNKGTNSEVTVSLEVWSGKVYMHVRDRYLNIDKVYHPEIKKLQEYGLIGNENA